ncbi:MAG: metallophosphoesterase [Acutalibacteraceae bacterium]|nr:metallophosphoesterase [Acutalibacteraceae bacterium]
MQYIVGLFEEIAALFLSILMMFGGVTTPATGDLLRNFSDDVNIDFVLTGDTQVCDYMPEREANLISFAEDMNNSDIELDAFLIVGDIAENGMQQEYDRITSHIADFNVKNFIMCTGNHDIRLRDFEQSKERFLGFMNNLNAEENAKDNVYFKYEVNGYTFLSIASDKMEFEEAHISREQLQWLNIELKEATKEGKPVFVLCHQSLAESHGLPNTWGSANSGAGDETLPTYERKDDYDFTGSIGEHSNDVYDIISKYENVFFLTGHLHTGFGKYTYQTINEENNVQGINVPSVGIDNKDGVYNNPGTGLFVEVTDSEVIFYARDFANGKFLTTDDWSKAVMKFDIQ